MERLLVRAGAGAYPVVVGEGLLERLGALFAEAGIGGRRALFADEAVLALHGEKVRAAFPDGGDAVRLPRVAVLSRRRRGYLELDVAREGSVRGRALLSAVRGPRTAFDACWYALVTLAARRRAARTLREGEGRWERDASSRTKE